MPIPDRFSSEHDLDVEEVTSHGRHNSRVKELHDPDAHVMLGKMAAAVAKLESTMLEAAREWREDRKAWREDRKALRKVQQRGAINVAGVMVVIQALLEVLRHAGILK